MKKNLYIIIAALIIGTCTKVTAQQSGQVEPLKQNLTFDIDNIGDAHITISMTYNASQWETFNSAYGNNAADIMKRQEERGLPSWYLQNWNYKDDGVNHTWTLQFDALGLAKIDDNGNWVIELDQKNPDISKMSDHNFAMTTTYNSSGVLVQQLWKFNFPSGANNISQDKDAFGKAIFTYEMTPGGKTSGLLFIIVGVLLLAAATVLYFKPDLLKFSKKQQVKPFTIVSAQQAPAAVAPITPEPPAANPDIEKQA